MADPHDGAFDRLEVVVNRLTLQLQEDAREFVDRLAKLETIPGEIGRFREEVRRAVDRAVTKDELDTAIQLALARHMNEELKRARKTIHDSQSISLPGSSTKVRVAEVQSRAQVNVALIAALAALGAAVIAIFK